MNRLITHFFPDFDPYQEILTMESRDSIFSEPATNDTLFSFEENTANTDLIDSVTRNKESMLYMDVKTYHDLLNVKLRSTSDDLIRVYGTDRPSEVTRTHFRAFNPHDDLFLADMPDITVAEVRACGSFLLDRVKKFKRENRGSTIMDEEWKNYLRLTDGLWITANHYLHSLDIPDPIKSLYPTEKNQTSLEGRIENTLFKWNYMATHGTTAEKVKYIPLVTLYAVLGIATLPLSLMYDTGSSYVRRTVNRIRRNNPHWVPLSEEHIRTDSFEKCPFWLYFVYHPEKDTPPDLTEDTFNPTPLINPHFYPRSLLKGSVSRLYDTMARTLDYYQNHDVPFNDSWIYQTRIEVLKGIKEVDTFAIKGI